MEVHQLCHCRCHCRCHCLQDIKKLMAQVREKEYEIRDQQGTAALLSAQLQTTQDELKEEEAANASALQTMQEMIAQDEHMLNELGTAQVGLTACEAAGVTSRWLAACPVHLALLPQVLTGFTLNPHLYILLEPSRQAEVFRDEDAARGI